MHCGKSKRAGSVTVVSIQSMRQADSQQRGAPGVGIAYTPKLLGITMLGKHIHRRKV